ncbi:hypothetical protein BDN72DRAFT_843413, partial [Pluteus cervinus]
MSPIFPPELEYEIFTLAFHHEIEDPIHLVLIARRVHDWLIPKIYRVVVFRNMRTYPRNISVPTLQIYGHHTRHLIISSGTPIVTRTLSCCPNLESLALWTGSWSDHLGLESHNVLTTLRLKGLSIHLGELERFDLENKNRLSLDVDEGEEAEIKRNIKQFLSTITHLDICTKVRRLSEMSSLKYCTSLTHICLFDSFPPLLLRSIFDVCNKLEVLICLISRSTEDEDFVVAVKANERLRNRVNTGSEGLSQDEIDRIVFVRCNSYGRDWENGARGEEDMWVLAER